MRTAVSLLLALAAFTVQAFEVNVVHGKRTLSGVVTFAESGGNYCFFHAESGEWWRAGFSAPQPTPKIGDIVEVSGEVLKHTVASASSAWLELARRRWKCSAGSCPTSSVYLPVESE